MGRFRRGGPASETDGQRRVRRSPLLFTAPIGLLVLLTAVLGWEVVRAHMTGEARADGPWRLEPLDTEPLGSLLAVAAGEVLARAQYARTVRPLLGRRADWATGRLGSGVPEWRVEALHIRVRVGDVVGDRHERIPDALKGARSASYQRPAP
ncbi:hypothetical protein [Streptomyces sp. NPDC004285]